MVRAGVEQPPIQFTVRVPFGALANLTAHEEQFFSGKKPLISEQSAQVREPLPVVAGHSAEERAFAMNDFIVRKGQNEILVVMIQHRESEIVLMIFSVNRFVAEIVEGVMHPTHVPLERKSQAAQVR